MAALLMPNCGPKSMERGHDLEGGFKNPVVLT